MAKAKASTATIELRTGEKVILNDYKNPSKFIEREKDFWGWANNSQNFLNLLSQLEQKLIAASTEKTNEAAETAMKMYYNDTAQPLIYSQSVIAAYIEDLREIDPQKGLLTLNLYRDIAVHQSELNKFSTQRIIWELLAIENGSSKKSLEINKRSLTALGDTYREKIAKEDDLLIEIEGKINKAEERATDLAKKTINSVTNRANENIEKIKLTDKTYREDMKLKASYKYWTDKKKDHGKNAGRYGIFLIFYFIISLGAFLFFGNFVLEKLLEHPLVITSLGLLVATPILWIGRLLARRYLSEQHLKLDADERSVMVLTYLALMADKGVTDEDRDSLLKALFRPSQDGIVKDDASPTLGLAKIVTNN